MLFNSYNFLFIFLPIFFSSIYLLKENLSRHKIFILVIIFSLIFYSLDNYNFTFLLLSSIIINFFSSKKIDKTLNKNKKKFFLFLIILFNLIILLYFKYFNFFIDNINKLSSTEFKFVNLSLPLAISFFTFQQISFQVDNFRTSKTKNFISYLLYVSFFPQLIAGPIIRYNHFIKEIFKNKFFKINSKNLSIGITIILIGLFKKIIFADTAALYVDAFFIRFNNGLGFTGIDSFLFIVLFSIQIYFDFSGYSDIAVGIGKILNFNIPINFNSPYKSKSIIDFWKRWHITLSQFFKDYFYIALGGNKNNFFYKLIIIIIVMTICGLWHGASNNFIFWGLLHGIMISSNHILNKFDLSFIKRIPHFIKILFTFCLISTAFIFFRVNDIAQSFDIIISVFDSSNNFNQSLFINEITFFNKLIMFTSIFVVFCTPNIFQIFDLSLVNIKRIDIDKRVIFKNNYYWIFFNLILIVFIIYNLGTPSTFIYFHF